MKQKKAGGFAHWLKDGILKGLVVLLVVVAGFYTYAQIQFPDTGPNVTSGVVGQFMGLTEDTFDSGQGYKFYNDLCESGNVRVLDSSLNIVTDNNLGAHVCTPDEMINSYNHGNAASTINNFYRPNFPFPPPTINESQRAWVNTGPPAYAFNANDCQGWTDTSNESSGTAWDFKGNFGYLQDCGLLPTAFACCK